MLKKILTFLHRIDPILLVLMAVLLGTGMMFLYGIGTQLGGRFALLWRKQLIWIAAGMFTFLVTAYLDYRIVARYSALFYLGANGLLISLFFIGTTINQATSWIQVGPFTIQPSELAKPAVILFLAFLVSFLSHGLKRVSNILLFGAALGVPAALVAVQPDWGTFLVFIPIGAAIAFTGGIPWRYILAITLLAVLTGVFAYEFVLEKRQRERIQTFFDPGADILDAGYNAHQSLLAVGSGGPFGQGYRNGHQYKLGYLPRTVAPTDFIFSVIGEETGFVGGLMLISALFGLMICCLRTAALAHDRLGTLICAGVVAFLFVHTYINIGMTIGAAPIIGIPLPLVSYGGSFMVATMACLGLVQSVYARRHEKKQL